MATWEYLPCIDISAQLLSVLAPIDGYEYITATLTKDYTLHNTFIGIAKYNTNTKKWTVWISYPDNIKSAIHSMAITQNKSFIYLHNSQSEVIKINTKTKEFQVKEVFEDGANGVSICIDDKFHIIGGWNHTSHKTFHDDNEAFTELCDLEPFKV